MGTSNAKWYGAPGQMQCSPSFGSGAGYWDYSFECNQPWADPPKTCSEYEGQKAGAWIRGVQTGERLEQDSPALPSEHSTLRRHANGTRTVRPWHTAPGSELRRRDEPRRLLLLRPRRDPDHRHLQLREAQRLPGCGRGRRGALPGDQLLRRPGGRVQLGRSVCCRPPLVVPPPATHSPLAEI